MKLIFASILLFSAKVFASEQVEANLRGASTENEDRHLDTIQDLDERDLLTIGATSKSLSFTIVSAKSSSDFCYDYNAVCLELGDAYTKTYADTDAAGNAIAFAVSEESLWLTACCRAYAYAFSLACAFTKVDGKVNVVTKSENSSKKVRLDVSLTTATTTFAIAEAKAVADAYTTVKAKSFTGVAAFCTAVGNKSLFCPGGTAATDLKQIAVATASSLGQSASLAAAGTFTDLGVCVYAEGSSINYVNGILSAHAKSWSFASASASASAFANAFTAVSNKSFAAVCAEEHGEVCSVAENKGKGVCNSSPDVACSAAFAKGKAWADALAVSCADTFIATYANSEVSTFLSANVDCRSTPIMSWSCVDAAVGGFCY